MPVLPKAKALQNCDYFPSPANEIKCPHIWNVRPPDGFLNDLYPNLDIVESIYPAFHIQDLARLYAKIALCAAVHQQGLDNVKSYVTPLILGRTILNQDVDVNYFVGAHITSDRDKLTHRINTITNKNKTIISNIRLFSMYGGPVFHVVVGEARELNMPERKETYSLKYSSVK